MISNKLDRRQVLRGVGLAALGGGAAAALAPTSALADNDGDGGLVGSWNLTIVDLSGALPIPNEGVGVYAPGGGFTTAYGGIPFVGLGAWAQRGGGKFGLTFLNFLFDFNPVKFTGTAKIRAEGTVHRDTQSGTYKFDVVDPSGANVFSGHGTFSGKRMRVEAV
jgi:hypothetical protein